MAGRKDTRRALSELYADVPPSRRRRLFRMAYDRLEQVLEEIGSEEFDGKRISPRSRVETTLSALRGLETLANIAKRADEHQEAAAKIATALASMRDGAVGPAVVIQEAPIDDDTPPESPPDEGEAGP